MLHLFNGPCASEMPLGQFRRNAGLTVVYANLGAFPWRRPSEIAHTAYLVRAVHAAVGDNRSVHRWGDVDAPGPPLLLMIGSTAAIPCSTPRCSIDHAPTLDLERGQRRRGMTPALLMIRQSGAKYNSALRQQKPATFSSRWVTSSSRPVRLAALTNPRQPGVPVESVRRAPAPPLASLLRTQPRGASPIRCLRR